MEEISFNGVELTRPSSSQENHHHYGIKGYDDDMGVSSMHLTFGSTSTAFFEGIRHCFAQWKVLVSGQLLALSLSMSGALSSSLHFECNLSAPAFQSIFLYLLMSFHLCPCYKNCAIQTNLKDEAKDTPRYTGEARIPSDDDGNDDGNDVDDDDDDEQAAKHWTSSETGNDKAVRHSFCYGSIRIYAPVWLYAIQALLDVEANYFTFLSYRYTTFNSASLLDSLSIPSAMVSSRLLLGRKYRTAHFIGAMICLCGVIWNVLIDYHQDKEDNGGGDPDNKYPNKVLGDFLAILGGVLYGLNDVLQETSVKNYGGPHEFLGMVGFFGTIISMVQALALETEDIRNFFQSSHRIPTNSAEDEVINNDTNTCEIMEGWSFLIGYVIIMYTSYVGGAYFLKASEAAMLNLSLLTADFWSAIFTIVVQQILPPTMFWGALFLTILGVFTYEIAPSPLTDDKDHSTPNQIIIRSIHSTQSVEKSKHRNDDEPLVSHSNGHSTEQNNISTLYNDDDAWAYDKDDEEIATFSIT